MKKRAKQVSLMIVFLSLICSHAFTGLSQQVNGSAFLKGNFVEMAIGSCGAFCSNDPVPAGYHPRGPVGNKYSGQTSLGFVADPARDGWSVGSPNFVGDYFLPGNPEEGFGITVNGNNYNNNMICLESGIQGSIVDYGNTSNQVYATWQGYVDGLTIKARTYVPLNGVYFVTEVSITNSSLTPAFDVYYMRNVDPDQGCLTPGGNGYQTKNTVVYQNPEACNRALVSSVSLTGNYYLGLGTIDSRARVCYGGLQNRNAIDAYLGNGFYTSGSFSEDIAMAIAFKLGTIEPNQTVKFSYAYILAEDQLSTALSETNLNYSVNGVTYSNNTPTNTCSGTATEVKINSSSLYSSWRWSPTNGLTLSSTDGQTASINITSPVTYTVVGTGTCGTVTLTIPLSPVTVNPPGPAGAITGPSVIDPGAFGVIYNTSQILNATDYVWSIPAGYVSSTNSTTSIRDITTAGTQINLNGPSAGGCGDIKVYGRNACGVGQASALTVCVPGIRAGSLSTTYSVNSLCSPLTSSLSFSSTNISFQSGNNFTVQLSDASGSFALPKYIGSLTSTSPNGLIPIQIPSGLPRGNNYRMKIVSSNPYYESTDNGMGLFMNYTIPASPTGILQELVDSTCGARIYRYTARGTIADTVMYRWTLPTSVGGVSGVFLDSGNSNFSRVIRVKYSSNNAAGSTDSIRVSSFSGCGLSSGRASAKLINTLISAPAAPASITITPVITNVCVGKVYRYAAPNLINATSAGAVAATGWFWSFTGNLGANATIDSGSASSQMIRVKFSSNNANAIGDSVRVAYTSSCGNSANRSARLTNTTNTAPAAPASLTITSVSTTVCSNRVYRYTAPALTGTAAGWQWSFVGTLGLNATVDSGTLTSRIVRMRFTSNAAAGTLDSARVLYTSTCGNSPNRSVKLTNALLAAPAAPASITTTAINTVTCGGRLYRYTAPNLTTATTTAGAASGWLWSFKGSLHTATNATDSTYKIDSGSVTSRVIRIRYVSNAAAATSDSVRVLYTSAGCGNSPNRAIKPSILALNPPAAPATLTQTLVSNICSNRVYRFATSALVGSTSTTTATTAAATGWQWSFVGNLGLNAAVDSGTLTSQIVRMKFSSNVGSAVGDSARVAYTTSGCGTGARITARLTNTSITCLGKTIAENTGSMTGQPFDIFPNPSSNEFTIRSKMPYTQSIQYKLLDVNGKLIQTGQLPSRGSVIFGSQLKSGIYFIESDYGKIRNVQKIIKQ